MFLLCFYCVFIVFLLCFLSCFLLCIYCVFIVFLCTIVSIVVSYFLIMHYCGFVFGYCALLWFRILFIVVSYFVIVHYCGFVFYFSKVQITVQDNYKKSVTYFFWIISFFTTDSFIERTKYIPDERFNLLRLTVYLSDIIFSFSKIIPLELKSCITSFSAFETTK